MKYIKPVENTGCKQDVNCTLNCGHIHVRTSWICNNWTAGLTAGSGVTGLHA